MTAENSATKRTFNITIMRPIFQVAILEIEAATRDEAIEIAQERELTLTEQDWNGPWERAIYDQNENGFEVFRGSPKRNGTSP
jgi:hypothetical protein